jgi:hypothetical protein
MPSRRRTAGAIALALALALACGCCSCGGLLWYAPEKVLLWALLEDQPLPGENVAATPLSSEEKRALRDDLLDDGKAELTSDQLSRMDAEHVHDVQVLRIAIDPTDAIRVDVSARDPSGKFLNVHTVGHVAVAGGHVTSARFDEIKVGKLNIGAWVAGRELGPDVDRSLQQRAAEDPELARKLGAIRSLKVEDGVVRLEIDPAEVGELLGPGG